MKTAGEGSLQSFKLPCVSQKSGLKCPNSESQISSFFAQIFHAASCALRFFFSGSLVLKLFLPSNPLFPLLLWVEGLGFGLWLRYAMLLLVLLCQKPTAKSQQTHLPAASYRMKDNPLPAYDIIVVGGSAGAVEGFQTLVRALPADFQAAIFFVLHIPVDYPSVLPKILSRAGSLPAEHPIDGEPVRHGRVYVAPPDRHLMLEDGVVRVKRGPRENRHRPAIDPLFRTAARVFGPRVIGVIMSGQMDDGAAGLHVIRSRGGIAIVQDPGDSASRDMPQSALEYGNVDYVLPASEIGPLLVKLVNKCAGDTMVERKKNGHKAEDNVEQNRTASTPEDGVGK